MQTNEPKETVILRCPDPVDCAECDDAALCLSEIIRELRPSQKRELLEALGDDESS